MTLTTFSSGTAAVASEVNNNFLALNIGQLYTGTDLNVSASGVAGADTESHELTAITAANLGYADYIIIDVSMTYQCRSDGGGPAEAFLKIEAKEIGGSYSDSLAETNMVRSDTDGSNSSDVYVTNTFRHVHTLTSGEKSAGIQFQLTTRVATNASGCTASITNRNVAVYKMG